MLTHLACWHRAVLRTLQFLTGASIIGGLIWGADVVGRPVVAFLTIIGAETPAAWSPDTPIAIMRGDIFLTRVLLGGAAIVFLFTALYAAVRLCLSLGSLVFELIGASSEHYRRLGTRDGRD